jgi:hypothetical protein
MWLLDAGVFIWAEKVGRLKAFGQWAGENGCGTTRTILDEVRRHAERRADKDWLDDPGALTVLDTPLDGPVRRHLERLRAGRTNVTNDLGEHEAIAWMVHRADLLFVTWERGAAWTCLQNVGPRVSAARWWLHEREGAMPEGLGRALLGEYRRRFPHDGAVWEDASDG